MARRFLAVLVLLLALAVSAPERLIEVSVAGADGTQFQDLVGRLRG